MKKILFLIISFSLPSILFGVEVCQIPSGCQIDENGVCLDCVEIDEEDTEEYKLQKKFEEDREQVSRERFWNEINLRVYGTHETHTFSFVGMNNSKIGRPYINEVTYSGFSIGTRLRLDSKFSYSISSFRGRVNTVTLNSDDESITSLSDNTFTTEMSGDLSYTDLTIDYNWNIKQWNWFLGLGVINYESDLIYKDLTYGSFKYEIDEQSLFLNSGVIYDFNIEDVFNPRSSRFLGLGLKVVSDSNHKSNSTDKKITQYNSSYTSPMIRLRIITTSISIGMSF
jgi:hypothetical protein